MKLEVQAACVTDWLPLVVSPPEGGGGRVAVGALQAVPSARVGVRLAAWGGGGGSLLKENNNNWKLHFLTSLFHCTHVWSPFSRAPAGRSSVGWRTSGGAAVADSTNAVHLLIVGAGVTNGGGSAIATPGGRVKHNITAGAQLLLLLLLLKLLCLGRDGNYPGLVMKLLLLLKVLLRRLLLLLMLPQLQMPLNFTWQKTKSYYYLP